MDSIASMNQSQFMNTQELAQSASNSNAMLRASNDASIISKTLDATNARAGAMRSAAQISLGKGLHLNIEA